VCDVANEEGIMTILELLKSKGYAPGDYFNVCRTCGKEFVGDKRAITCAGCASEQVGAVAKPETPCCTKDGD